MTESTKPSTMFWSVAIIALIWNAMGVMAYLAQVTMTPETLALLPENEQALIASVPMWATAAFAIAVWGGALGSLLLLLRKKLATMVLMISFGGVVVQMIHSFFMANSMEVYGPGGMMMPIMVLGIGAYLIWFSKRATASGWLS